MKAEIKITAATLHALVFGLFLGLCIWKFGNPVILDQKIAVPTSLQEYLTDAWPTHWARWFLVPLVLWGGWLILQKPKPDKVARDRTPVSRWLWLLPLAWFSWQCFSTTATTEEVNLIAPGLTDLSLPTLWQFAGCVAGYFLGLCLFTRQTLPWLLLGLLAAFAYCQIRAVDQRVFEFPVNYQMLVEGERSGWTNFPPATVDDMRNTGVIIVTNGVEAANPIMLAKFAKGRVAGTLVYPNALSQLILLLWPVSLTLAFCATRKLRPLIRHAAILTTCGLGSAAFFWTGSKLGWLLALVLAGVALLRLDWSRQLKFAAVLAVLVLGLGVFAVRFHHYFAAGATSAGARLDYWRAAVQTTAAHPLFGTGPGTFQRPYARLKSPDAEMARLTHNDFLEQFSDSGLPGGLTYAAWIVIALVVIGRRVWSGSDPVVWALYLGVTGWFLQGLGEFGLYIPALAWTAFTILGLLIAQKSPETDHPKA